MNPRPHITRRSLLQASAAALIAGLPLPQRLSAQDAQAMSHRKIPATGELIPIVGMGTWQTFDVDPDDRNATDPLREVLRAFFDAGGRVIDSSPMYGRSEEVVGKLTDQLKINDQLFIATKVWTQGEQRGVEQMDDSLAKLGREKLELMQVHNLLDLDTHLRTLRRWKEQGRIRYIGFTHYQVSRFDELMRLMKREKPDFVQFNYSVAEPDAEQSILPLAHDLGIATLINRPFLGGAMFRKLRDVPLPEPMQPFAKSWAQAMLKYILAEPAVTCVIPATSNPKHMVDNVQAGFGDIPDAAARQALRQAISRL